MKLLGNDFGQVPFLEKKIACLNVDLRKSWQHKRNSKLVFTPDTSYCNSKILCSFNKNQKGELILEKEMNTLTETIEKFRSKQFIYDFYIQDGYLKCNETNEKFRADEVIIERTERYEGDSNPDDMSIIYAITTKSGTQGILIDAFGAYANSRISDYIKNVPVREKDENQVKSS